MKVELWLFTFITGLWFSHYIVPISSIEQLLFDLFGVFIIVSYVGLWVLTISLVWYIIIDMYYRLKR